MKLFKIRSKSPFSGKEAHDLPWFIQDIIYASILGDGYLQKQYQLQKVVVQQQLQDMLFMRQDKGIISYHTIHLLVKNQ